MAKDKTREIDSPVEPKEATDTTSRARNRTVMLTPEMTGQVRALFNTNKASEDEKFSVKKSGIDDYLPPASWGSDSNKREEESAVMVNESIEETVPEVKSATEELIFNSKTDFDGSLSEKNLSPESININEITTKHGDTVRDMDTKQPNFAVNTAATSASVTTQPVARKRKGKVVAFLISYDKDKNGEVYELSAGRWFITSKPTDHGESILVDDESVSPSHAIIRATEAGKVHVLDQLSEYGTYIVPAGAAQEEDANGQVALDHGCMVRFGNRRFMVCLVPPMPSI